MWIVRCRSHVMAQRVTTTKPFNSIRLHRICIYFLCYDQLPSAHKFMHTHTLINKFIRISFVLSVLKLKLFCSVENCFTKRNTLKINLFTLYTFNNSVPFIDFCRWFEATNRKVSKQYCYEQFASTIWQILLKFISILAYFRFYFTISFCFIEMKNNKLRFL